MTLPNAIKGEILAYLYEAFTLDELRNRIAGFTLRAGIADPRALDSDGQEAFRIASQLIGDFSDLDEGYITEIQLRQQLRNMLFGQVTTPYIEIPSPLGQIAPAAIKTASSSEITFEEASAFLGRTLAWARG